MLLINIYVLIHVYVFTSKTSNQISNTNLIIFLSYFDLVGGYTLSLIYRFAGIFSIGVIINF